MNKLDAELSEELFFSIAVFLQPSLDFSSGLFLKRMMRERREKEGKGFNGDKDAAGNLSPTLPSTRLRAAAPPPHFPLLPSIPLRLLPPPFASL